MEFIDLSRYDYTLPEELIRKEGVEPRDSARLFVYDTETDTITLDTFRNIGKYLPSRSTLVVNATQVLPVRLWLNKETGGKIEVFVLANQMERGDARIPVMVDRKVSIGQRLFFPNRDSLEVLDQENQIFFVKIRSISNLTLRELLEQFGKTPLPHYLEGEMIPETTLRARYQTIFATTGASVAAPTAGLHFTETVFDSLREKGIVPVSILLDVGRGTFSPLSEEHFSTRSLHAESIRVSDETVRALNQSRQEHRSIIAVGTTALRTLESTCHTGVFSPYSGKTDIFIFPPYHFRGADILVTNFHLPKTSLMLLVDAFLQNKGAKRNLVELYRIAIKECFSFYSFGDSMLIL